MDRKVRVIAFYLPQFYPIPENDKWWGKGFTEWTNVGKAKPLFRGHYQPKVPADLGYYDLRMAEVREAQAEMARNAGIEGFMYWHYWFGNGKTILERPFKEVLNSSRPEFPFCLGWANHSWTTHTWDATKQYSTENMLMEQCYGGEKDYVDHFHYVQGAFKDKRYITVDEKPLFYVYAPLDFKDVRTFINIWRSLAKEKGFKGIYFIGQSHRNKYCKQILDLGFDGICRAGIYEAEDKIKGKYRNKIMNRLRQRFKTAPLKKFKYSDIVRYLIDPELDRIENIYPQLIPNFDHTPRSGRKGFVYTNSHPKLFKTHIEKAIDAVKGKDYENRILFLRSWNEWGEGNYVEPDLIFGHGYLNAIRESVIDK